jgi:hypothetical protein
LRLRYWLSGPSSGFSGPAAAASPTMLPNAGTSLSTISLGVIAPVDGPHTHLPPAPNPSFVGFTRDLEHLVKEISDPDAKARKTACASGSKVPFELLRALIGPVSPVVVRSDGYAFGTVPCD